MTSDAERDEEQTIHEWLEECCLREGEREPFVSPRDYRTIWGDLWIKETCEWVQTYERLGQPTTGASWLEVWCRIHDLDWCS